MSAPANKTFVWKPRKLNDLDAIAVGGVCAEVIPVKASPRLQLAVSNLEYILISIGWTTTVIIFASPLKIKAKQAKIPRFDPLQRTIS